MAKIILDRATSALLRWVKEPVELFDEDGCRLGTVTPVDKKSLYREVEIPFTEEELRRFEQEEGAARSPRSWPIWRSAHLNDVVFGRAAGVPVGTGSEDARPPL
jgi:hypothetical protein